MRFATFLTTLVGGSLPKTRVKNDLVNFKELFKYAEKSDMLYNNLIDNIFWLLETKFAKFELLYNSSYTAYSELSLIVSSQIPQFMFIQKKQLLESLDTFAELHNWGSVTKDNVKRLIVGDDTDTSSSGYIPIDGTTLDPYSKDSVNKQSSTNETTDYNRNTTDFLSFFSRMRWNTATIDLEKILKPYYSLFVTMVVPNNNIIDEGGGGSELDELKKEIEAVASVAGQNSSSIVRLREKDGQQDGVIQANTNSIGVNTAQIVTLNQQMGQKIDRTTADSLYLTQAKGDARYALKSSGNFITQPFADARYLQITEAARVYITKNQAEGLYTRKETTSELNTRLINAETSINTIGSTNQVKYTEVEMSRATETQPPGGGMDFTVNITDFTGLRMNRIINCILISKNNAQSLQGKVDAAAFTMRFRVDNSNNALVIFHTSLLSPPLYSGEWKRNYILRIMYWPKDMGRG